MANRTKRAVQASTKDRAGSAESSTPEGQVAAPGAASAEARESAREYLALVKRADQGDREALQQIRRYYELFPELWEQAGNLARQVEDSWVRTILGEKQVVAVEATQRKLKALRQELEGSAPTPLERLLVDRIIACWLQVQYADATYAQRMKDLTWVGGDYYQRRMDRAHARYLAAIRTLAQVRRLLVPVVQVNIADKQVNVAQQQVSLARSANARLSPPAIQPP